MYGDKVIIQDINGQIQINNSFDDFLDDKFYTIIDKESIAQYIGRKIIDEEKDFDIDKDWNIIWEMIDTLLINDITQNISDYVYEYLNNNK